MNKEATYPHSDLQL